MEDGVVTVSDRGTGQGSVIWECPKFCVSDFCEGGFAVLDVESEASAAWRTSLLGRTERSSPEAA